jgi:hypothetical protein
MHLRFSQDIETLLHRLLVQPLTLREILSQTSERGFCLTISLLVLPLMCLGYVITVINTLFFGFIGYLAWVTPQFLPQIFQ